MKQIPLTQGQFAIVDDMDYEWLSKYKWYALWCKNTQSFYALRDSKQENGKHTLILMAREILGLKRGDKRQSDHKNHHTLDNQRHNLRVCTHQQNQHNQKPQKNRTSKYKGVSWDKTGRKWRTVIQFNQQQVNVGTYKTEIDAAKAYEQKAKELFGEFAYTKS